MTKQDALNKMTATLWGAELPANDAKLLAKILIDKAEQLGITIKFDEPVEPLMIDANQIDIQFISEEIVRGMTNADLNKKQQSQLRFTAQLVMQNHIIHKNKES